MAAASILWRRLDTPGHDACRLQRTAAGWAVEGAAVFRHDHAPAWAGYRVTCDDAWRTLEGEVRGWLGSRAVVATMARASDGTWRVNGKPVPGLESCVDLDLAFTPATNLLQLRRVALAEGQAAEVPAAWYHLGADTLACLPQRYERRSSNAYWYEAPSERYAGLLETDATGFVRRYPGLWEAEP